eukprot:4359527-Alexandrium_andersonii.AAC.1
MSASLVGSEMCIRDSRRHASNLAAPAGARQSVGPGSAAAKAQRAYRPVSYTHLTLPTICSV